MKSDVFKDWAISLMPRGLSCNMWRSWIIFYLNCYSRFCWYFFPVIYCTELLSTAMHSSIKMCFFSRDPSSVPGVSVPSTHTQQLTMLFIKFISVQLMHTIHISWTYLAKCQFAIPWYGFPLVLSGFLSAVFIATGFIAEKFLALFLVCSITDTTYIATNEV